MSFLPTAAPAIPTGTIPGDGFYPDLSVADFYTRTGITGGMPDLRVRDALDIATWDTRAALADWQQLQTALDDTQTTHYQSAVFYRARAILLELSRDYHTTKEGHQRADALEQTSQTFYRLAHQALTRLTGKPYRRVRLI